MICGFIHYKVTILIIWISACFVVHFRRCSTNKLTHITMISSPMEPNMYNHWAGVQVRTHAVALACQCHKFSPGASICIGTELRLDIQRDYRLNFCFGDCRIIQDGSRALLWWIDGQADMIQLSGLMNNMLRVFLAPRIGPAGWVSSADLCIGNIGAQTSLWSNLIKWVKMSIWQSDWQTSKNVIQVGQEELNPTKSGMSIGVHWSSTPENRIWVIKIKMIKSN
jgi:hypothetical protein